METTQTKELLTYRRNTQMTTVFDIETDGLLDELTKIHVLSWSR